MPDALEPPYPGYLERLFQRLGPAAAAAQPPASAHAGAPEPLRKAIADAVEASSPQLVELAHDLHAHPELAFDERHAVKSVAALLGSHGHDVEVGAYGLATALRARAGSGRPRVAVLAEYDALPEIGHACGHNVICATAVGAFLALADVAGDLDGSVELIGAPAEEGGGGKELIAQAGGFDEIDAALMIHPQGLDIAEHPWIGVRQVEVTYHGLAAHASAFPFMGRNALDAAVQAYTAIAQLRQHILASDRVHGIITDGGQRPNIVPERATAVFYVRSGEPETLIQLSDRVNAILEAAATATGTAAEIVWDPCPVYLPVRHNHPLAARYAANVATRGRKALPPGIVPDAFTGSTDMGNISVRVPSIHPYLAIAPPTVTIHTPEFAIWAASELADRGVVDGALGLALTAADYLSDAELRKAAAEDFEAAGGKIEVEAFRS